MTGSAADWVTVLTEIPFLQFFRFSYNYYNYMGLILLIVSIKPNSRTTLIDEQSNPSQRVHQEDVMSRHRNL